MSLALALFIPYVLLEHEPVDCPAISGAAPKDQLACHRPLLVDPAAPHHALGAEFQVAPGRDALDNVHRSRARAVRGDIALGGLLNSPGSSYSS